MRVPRLSSGGFRRLTTVNLVLLVAIIVSGAVVRLTNSGLGCRDWPNCSADHAWADSWKEMAKRTMASWIAKSTILCSKADG